MNSLINYTNDQQLAHQKEVFKSFIKLWQSVNSNLSDKDIALTKRCIADDNITAKELDYGFINAYKDPDRYGKVEWSHIWKHVLKLRNGNNGILDNNKIRKHGTGSA